MEKIKVGEYVKLYTGEIAQVVSIENIGGINNIIFYELDKVNTGRIYSGNKQGTVDADIVNHSENLKDLVEVGDFVNGCIVDEDCRGLHIVTKDLEVFYLKDITIKSIATKEQFKEIEYEV